MTKLEEIAQAIAKVVSRDTSDDYNIDGIIAERAARAAIEAMREPSEAMTEYAYKTMEIDSPDESYRHMIDAILNEKP